MTITVTMRGSCSCGFSSRSTYRLQVPQRTDGGILLHHRWFARPDDDDIAWNNTVGGFFGVGDWRPASSMVYAAPIHVEMQVYVNDYARVKCPECGGVVTNRKWLDEMTENELRDSCQRCHGNGDILIPDPAVYGSIRDVQKATFPGPDGFWSNRSG